MFRPVRISFVFAAFLISAPCGSLAEDEPNSGPVFIGSVEELRQRVLEHNWSIQAKIMEYEIRKRTQEAAKGAFDPLLLAQYQYEDTARPNTVEQRRSLSGIPTLAEQNHQWRTSLETLTPLGGKLGITASVSEFHNNLQRITSGGFGATGQSETVTFIGVNFRQPLLRDAGRKTATAAIRVAACETEQAWQEFRRQLMVSISSAELAYWNVYGAARQVDYMQESLKVAGTMSTDAKAKSGAGKGAPVEVTTAQAGIEERNARLTIARQRLIEAKAVLAGFCGAAVTDGFEVSTTAPPPPNKVTPDVQNGLANALATNPDYLSKIAEKDAEGIRADYMKNQNLPQLDFTASYGLNGLGTDLNRSYSDIEEAEFEAWGVGLEFKMPLGNREAKNRYAAALARQKRAEDAVTDVRQQLSNAVDSAVEKVISTRSALGSYYRGVALNQQVLNSRLVDLKEGKADARRVLEADDDLNQSRINAVSGLIQHRQAMLEYELATGQVLENRAITITKEEVRDRTRRMMKGKRIKEDLFEEYLDAVRGAAKTNQ
jgi:outer membrane protein TolC